MHIVYVCREFVGSARSGGIGSYIDEMARFICGAGHRVTIVTANDDTRVGRDTLTPYGARVIALSGGDFLVPSVEGGGKIRKLRGIYRFYSYRNRVKECVESLDNVDLIEVADYGSESYCLNRIGIPVVLRMHTPMGLVIKDKSCRRASLKSPLSFIQLKAEKEVIENARYISSCSRSLAEWIKSHYNVANADFRVIHNPVGIREIKACGSKGGSKPMIFYGGTISDTKGVGELVEACRRLNAAGVDFRLVIAGKGGSYEKRLAETVLREGLDWCEMIGKITRDQMYDYYSRATVCCFPSWWENMPMVCLEAMSVGAVVLASTSGGAKEIIDHGKNGFLAEAKNVDSLYENLKQSMSLAEDERAAIACNAAETIRSRFSAGFIGGQMLDYYNRVILDYKHKTKGK